MNLAANIFADAMVNRLMLGKHAPNPRAAVVAHNAGGFI